MQDVVQVRYLAAERLTEFVRRQDLLAVLSTAERAQAARFRFEKDRTSYIGAHALLRVLLSAAYPAVAAAEWEFTVNAHGRPEIAPALACGLNFSISHTDGMAACAIAFGRVVGVDVEHSERRAPLDIAPECLTTDELADLTRCAAEHKAERFFYYWTLKEAYLKALGVGLHRPLNSVAIVQTTSGRLTVERADSAEWRLESHRREVYQLAVCCERGGTEPRIIVCEYPNAIDFDSRSVQAV